MRLRFAPAMAVLFVVALGGAVWAAQVKVREATLYVSAPAEVNGALGFEGNSASFDLPKGLVPDSLQAKQGEATISSTVQPIYGPRRDPYPAEIDHYQASLSGLRAGAPVELVFRTAGLEWTPGVALTVQQGQSRLSVQASISNTAIDLTGARIRLMSGRVGSAPFLSEDAEDFVWYSQMMQEIGRGSAAEQAGGLHLLKELANPDVPVGGVRQVPMLSAEVSVVRSYWWDTSAPRDSEPRQAERAHAIYSFRNTSSSPLPDGMVTVSEGGTVIGSGFMSWTPPGETAVIAVGSGQGLVVRRSEETVAQPKTWENQRTAKLRVENSRGDRVTVRVIEHLRPSYEYGYDEEITPVYEFSQQPQTGKEGSFTWDLPVPAGGDAALTYSYREPVDLTSLRILSFPADGSPKERAYLVDAPHSDVKAYQGDYLRRLQPDGYLVYRLPMPSGVSRAEVRIGLGNAFRVFLAPEVNGKPGAYKVVADATAIAGKVVRDGTNWNHLIFNLAPFLSDTSRAVYLRIENPESAEAFTKGADVYRIPEGFETRAPGYATGEGGGVSAAPSSARRVLYSFDPYTPQEEAVLFTDVHTAKDGQNRVLQYSGRIVYAFTIPPEVSSADCLIKVGNGFSVSVARDSGAKPGEFHEELNTLGLLKRRVYFNENLLDYPIDLTPYLQDNPTRTVYVEIYHSDPADDYGVWLLHVEVAVLDDAERNRFQRLKRSVDAMAQEDQDRYLLNFMTIGDSVEGQYIYDSGGSEVRPGARSCDRDRYVIYRLPLTANTVGAEILVTAWGDIVVVSLAPEVTGKPGEFREVARTNAHPRISVTPAMVAAGACYVKVACGNTNITVRQISIRRP